MITLNTPAVSLPSAHPPASFVAAVVRICRQVTKGWRHRHDVALLAAMDDRMLADIGLTRGDLNSALSQSLWRDPTRVLVRLRGGRRMSRSAVADLLRRAAAPPTAPDGEVLHLPPRNSRVRATL